MNVLLIGAGRMGLRHLRGLTEINGEVHVVDPRTEAANDVHRATQEYGLTAKVFFYNSLHAVPFGEVEFDSAILSETAHGRLERFQYIAAHGIKNVLIEKPIEQSRGRFHEIRKLAIDNSLRVRCNHWLRSLPFFAELREQGGPFQIVVTGGAFGLGCNGIHWLDFAVYLTKSSTAKMLFGEIEATQIGSGRGASFREYSGRGLFAFEDGSRLFLSSSADSSAPTIAAITQRTRQYVMDQEKDLIIAYERDFASTKPNYLCGADYARREIIGGASVQLWELTKGWIRWLGGCGECLIPTIDEAALGHELLFDLLETSRETEFAIT